MVDITLKEKKALDISCKFEGELFKSEQDIINAIIDIFPIIKSDIDILLGFYNFTPETRPVDFLNIILELFAEVEERDFFIAYDSVNKKYEIKIKHEFQIYQEAHKFECEDIVHMVQEAKLMFYYIINYIQTVTDCANLYDGESAYHEMIIERAKEMLEEENIKHLTEEDIESNNYILENYDYQNGGKMKNWLSNYVEGLRCNLPINDDVIRELVRKYPEYELLASAYKLMEEMTEDKNRYKHLFYFINPEENSENAPINDFIIICHSQDLMTDQIDAELESLSQNTYIEELSEYLSVDEVPSNFPNQLFQLMDLTQEFIKTFYHEKVKYNEQLLSS